MGSTVKDCRAALIFEPFGLINYFVAGFAAAGLAAAGVAGVAGVVVAGVAGVAGVVVAGVAGFVVAGVAGFTVLLLAVSPQAIPRALNVRTAESAIVFFIFLILLSFSKIRSKVLGI